MLIISFVTFDTCLARFIIETGGWSAYEGEHGNCRSFMVNDDSELNKAEFSGICSKSEGYDGIESHCENILLRNRSFYN